MLTASAAELDMHAQFFSPVFLPSDTIKSDAGLQELLDLIIDRRVRDAVITLIESGKPVPVVGYELEGSRGGVAAEAEIAWPDQKVAVLVGEQTGFREVFLTHDWSVLVPDEEKEWVEILMSFL